MNSLTVPLEVENLESPPYRTYVLSSEPLAARPCIVEILG